MENQHKYHPLDQLFGERLSNYESSYPDRIWTTVSSSLVKSEDDTAPAFWILFFFASLLAIYLMLDLKNNIPNHKVSSVENIKQTSSTLLPDLNSLTSINGAGAAESNSSEIVESKILNTNETYGRQSSEIARSKILPPEPPDLVVSNSTSISNNSDYVNATLDTELPVSKDLINEDLRLAKKILERPVFNRFASLNSLDAAGVQISEQTLEAFFKKTTPSDCPVFSGNKPGFAMDIYYSSDYPFSKLTPRNIEDQAYSVARDNTESSIYSFSAGLRASYYLRPNLAIRGGFNYSQINEKFKYEDPDSEQIRTIITIDTVVIGGITTVTMDTSTIIIKGVAEIQHQNRYKFLDIPLMVGYEIPYQRYNVNLNGGILFNFAFNQSGRFLNPALEVQDLNPSDFRNSVGISLYASIGLAYQLDERFSILIEPNIRHFLGSVTSTNYPLEQNYTTIGLLTGLRYRF